MRRTEVRLIVSVSPTEEQYRRMKEAIANQRRIRNLLAEMENESRRAIFAAAPHNHHRKRIPKKILGTT